ncbi:MAG: hypothetical protein Q8L86_19345 [Vicinamibacterales bacterium]|nr:hypothetical protein [Vicinamibacterales bacterium]
MQRALAAGAIAWAIGLAVAAPNLRILADPVTYPQRYDLVARQVADPFVRAGGVWDGDFMAYRILVPGAIHLTGLPAWTAVAAIWFAGLLTLALVWVYLATYTTHRTAWLKTIGLACTPLIQGSHIYVGYPDAVGWLIVMALALRPPAAWWGVGACLVMFNDERGLVALPFALALALYDERHDVPALISAARPIAAAVAAGLAAALVLRWIIATGLLGGAPVPEGLLPRGPGFDSLSPFHLAGLALAFKAYWVLVAWAGVVAATERTARPYWLAVASVTLVAIAACGQVFDFWRGLATLFPLVLLAARVLHDHHPPALARALPALTLAMVALPQLEQMNEQIRWLRPLPLALYEWRTGASLADVLRGLLSL